jgi:hypothetical protein
MNGADAAATEAALAGVPGLQRVVAEPHALALYVEDGAGSIAEIVRRLDQDGIEVKTIAASRPSLDDVFLSATGSRRSDDGRSSSPVWPLTWRAESRRPPWCCSSASHWGRASRVGSQGRC